VKKRSTLTCSAGCAAVTATVRQIADASGCVHRDGMRATVGARALIGLPLEAVTVADAVWDLEARPSEWELT